MASSIASLARAGFMGVLALGCAAALGLPLGKTGGGGGGATIGAGGRDGGGGGIKTVGEVEVGAVEEEGGSALLASSEAAFRNFSSSSVASDLVFRTQRSETMVIVDTLT